MTPSRSGGAAAAAGAAAGAGATAGGSGGAVLARTPLSRGLRHLGDDAELHGSHGEEARWPPRRMRAPFAAPQSATRAAGRLREPAPRQISARATLMSLPPFAAGETRSGTGRPRPPSSGGGRRRCQRRRRQHRSAQVRASRLSRRVANDVCAPSRRRSAAATAEPGAACEFCLPHRALPGPSPAAAAEDELAPEQERGRDCGAGRRQRVDLTNSVTTMRRRQRGAERSASRRCCSRRSSVPKGYVGARSGRNAGVLVSGDRPRCALRLVRDAAPARGCGNDSHTKAERNSSRPTTARDGRRTAWPRPRRARRCAFTTSRTSSPTPIMKGAVPVAGTTTAWSTAGWTHTHILSRRPLPEELVEDARAPGRARRVKSWR